MLVVETTNIHPLQRYRGNSSENLTVHERFSRVDEETILYEFTIDDPTTYTASWGERFRIRGSTTNSTSTLVTRGTTV